MSFRFGMDRFKGGNSGVGYDNQGRVLWQPSPRPLPRGLTESVEPKDTLTGGWRQFFTNRGREDPVTAYDKRYDWRSSERSTEEGVGGEEVIVEKRQTDGVMVEDRLVYREKPRFWWLFVILGILLLVLGVVNVLFCLDFHWYSRFYTGILLLIFGVLGLLHNGTLRTKGWRTLAIIYMIVGIITMALVFLCLGQVLFTFVHETIDIAQYGDDDFIDITITRIMINSEKVRMNITSWEGHIWICYAMDGISIAFCLVGFLVMTSVIIVFDNFYNNNFIYIRQVEPFCEPMLWNPYGQISLGQVMVFFGFIISDAVFGSNAINYQDTLPLVWAGIPAMICGFVSAVAYKRTHKGARVWAIAAIILQIINVIVSIIAVALMTYGMWDNIVTIDENYTMTTTNFSVQLMSASVIMFVIGDCVALANIFWALACLTCHFKRSCCGSSESRTYFENEIDDLSTTRSSGEIITTPMPMKKGPPPPMPDRVLTERIQTSY